MPSNLSAKRIQTSRRRSIQLIAIIMLAWLAFVCLSRFKLSTYASKDSASHWRPQFSAQLEQGDQRELDVLPGVGPKTAQKWVTELGAIELRAKDDLEQLSGVGPARAEKLAPFLLTTDQSTIDDNHTESTKESQDLHKSQPKATKSGGRKKSSNLRKKPAISTVIELEETNRTPADTLNAQEKQLDR